MSLASFSSRYISNSAVEVLKTVTWPLIESLDLSRTILSREAIHALSQDQFLQLKQLSLDQTDLGADCCDIANLPLALNSVGSRLALFQCPILETLDLSRNLDIRTRMLQLMKVPWPALKHLVLRGIKLDKADLRTTFEQGWPTLVSLDLHLLTSHKWCFVPW